MSGLLIWRAVARRFRECNETLLVGRRQIGRLKTLVRLSKGHARTHWPVARRPIGFVCSYLNTISIVSPNSILCSRFLLTSCGEVTGVYGSESERGLHSVEDALASLCQTVEKHRLTFLFFARPQRRNPMVQGDCWERLSRYELPDERIPIESIDSDGRFLFTFSAVLDTFAQAAVSRFGPGNGAKPTALATDGSWVEVDGGSLPFWCLDECGCRYLEESSDALLDACKVLLRVDESRQFHGLARQVRNIAHDEGQSRWYSSVLVRWKYLAALDELISRLKAAPIDYLEIVSGSTTEIRKRETDLVTAEFGGWQFRTLSNGEVEAQNKALCDEYTGLGEQDLLGISTRWRLMVMEFTEATRRTGHYRQHITHETEVQRVTKLLELAVSQRGIKGVSRLGRCLRRPDDEHLHWALTTLDELDAQLRSEYCNKSGIKEGDEASPDIGEISEMPVEDRRNSGLILLMLLAQAYYKMLECTVSMASWCTAMDLELNESYLWTVKTLRSLLENHEDLQDFPFKFDPLFSDLYPATIAGSEWEDMVAPDAEHFLSTVQRYVHEKCGSSPAEGSPGWIFVELFRPAINMAIERAVGYHSRMLKHCQRVIGRAKTGEPEASSMHPRGNKGKACVVPSANELPGRRSNVDFVIVTPLAEERDAVLEKLPGHRQLPPSKEDIRVYYAADIPVSFPGGSQSRYSVVVAPLAKMGHTEAATATGDALRRWQPRYVFVGGDSWGHFQSWSQNRRCIGVGPSSRLRTAKD